jgi:hypothetical protein
MAGSFKMFLWDWNPVRNRQLLIRSQLRMASCHEGWCNTHDELVDARDKIKHLESEIARLERLSNG